MIPEKFKGDILANIPDYQKLLDAMVEASEVKPEAKILDYGARTGALTIRLLEKEPTCEIAVIVAPFPKAVPPEQKEKLVLSESKLEEWIGYFNEHLEASKHKDKVQILDVPLFELKEQNSFDIVASSYTLHHFPNEDKIEILSKILSLLKPEGKFILNERFFRFTDDMSAERRLGVVLEKLARVAPIVMKYCGQEAAMHLFDNYRATYLMDGEYPLSLDGYFKMCGEAGFEVDIYKVDWIYDNVILKCLKTERRELA